MTIVEEGRKRVIAIIAGILVVKQFREEELSSNRSARRNGARPADASRKASGGSTSVRLVAKERCVPLQSK